MKKLMLPVAMVAFFALSQTANAAACKDAKGKFIKCPPAAAAAPAMAPAKPAVAKAAAPAPAVKAAAPAMAPAKAGGPCKDAKGKFIKCAPAAAPAMAPAKPAAAGGKKAPCRDAKGRFAKC